jgi:hypothetical protein
MVPTHGNDPFAVGSYSVFDSALNGKRIAKWLFPKEEATFDALPMRTDESKTL